MKTYDDATVTYDDSLVTYDGADVGAVVSSLPALIGRVTLTALTARQTSSSLVGRQPATVQLPSMRAG